jgi:carbon starvation protein
MLQDTIGNVYKPFKQVSWKPGVWSASAVIVALWGYFLYTGVTNPLGGINQLFPLFGIANQLLAAIALTVVTVVIIKRGLLKWAWIPGVPLMWDLIVTMTASWQKIFSGDPKVGYWSQHAQYVDAKDAGKTAFGAAKNVGQIDAVIRNTFIQGTLSVIFAVLVVIVFAAGVIVALQVIRGGGRPLSADEPVPSRIFAPSGMMPTAAEKEVQKQWDELPPAHDKRAARSVGTGAH